MAASPKPGERQSLLPPSGPPFSEAEEQLPKMQIFILLYMRLSEPIAFQIVLPFINQMIYDLRIAPDAASVGFYSGLIESSFAITQFFCIYHWSNLSDRIGRRLPLVFGLFFVSVFVTLFGLSTSLLGLVAIRACAGALNGNPSIIRSAIGDITSRREQEAKVFAWLATTATIGSSIATFMGGQLQDPATRFSIFEDVRFLISYPYFLPCFVAALVPLSSSALALFCFKETLLAKVDRHEQDPPQQSLESANATRKKSSVLNNRRVLLVLCNLTALLVTTMAMFAIIPLFSFTPVQHSGLGLDPTAIGKVLSFLSLTSIVIQLTAFAPLQKRYGTIGLYRRLVIFFPIGTACFALASLKAGTQLVWVPFITALICVSIGQMAFICGTLSVNSASPDRATLGSINGLAQMCSAFAKAVSPWATSSLFAFSASNGGWMIWLVLSVLSLGLTILTWTLPEM